MRRHDGAWRAVTRRSWTANTDCMRLPPGSHTASKNEPQDGGMRSQAGNAGVTAGGAAPLNEGGLAPRCASYVGEPGAPRHTAQKSSPNGVRWMLRCTVLARDAECIDSSTSGWASSTWYATGSPTGSRENHTNPRPSRVLREGGHRGRGL